MFIGIKIKNLVKARGLLIKTLTEKWDIQPHHFSRMIKEKLVFNDKKVAIAADFLGVTPEYLRDESRPFNPGDTIPPDALAEKKPPDITTTDPVKALLELAEMNMAHRKAVDSQIPPEIMAKATEELINELSGLAMEVRLLREEMARAREENDGEGDSD